MSDHDHTTPDPADDATDASAAHDADRMPTEEEERLAEKGAEGVDLDSVTRHEREMAEKGAAVEGEGQITPS